LIKQFQTGDTILVVITHQTYSFSTDTWADADPDANFPKITINKPDGTMVVNSVTMDTIATGKFQYPYEISLSDLGWWTGFIIVENNGYTDKEYFGFTVKV